MFSHFCTFNNKTLSIVYTVFGDWRQDGHKDKFQIYHKKQNHSSYNVGVYE